MIKKIKRYGNTAGINFTKEELKNYDLKVGDLIDLEFFKIKLKSMGKIK